MRFEFFRGYSRKDILRIAGLDHFQYIRDWPRGYPGRRRKLFYAIREGGLVYFFRRYRNRYWLNHARKE